MLKDSFKCHMQVPDHIFSHWDFLCKKYWTFLLILWDKCEMKVIKIKTPCFIQPYISCTPLVSENMDEKASTGPQKWPKKYILILFIFYLNTFQNWYKQGNLDKKVNLVPKISSCFIHLSAQWYCVCIYERTAVLTSVIFNDWLPSCSQEKLMTPHALFGYRTIFPFHYHIIHIVLFFYKMHLYHKCTFCGNKRECLERGWSYS